MSKKKNENKIPTDTAGWENEDKLLKSLMEEFGVAEVGSEEKSVNEQDEEDEEGKQLFGSKGDNYYFLIEEGDDPSNFKIVDAEEALAYEPEVEEIDIKDFVHEAVVKLDLDSIAWNVIDKYDLLGLKEEEEEEVEVEEEVPETPEESEEVPGE